MSAKTEQRSGVIRRSALVSQFTPGTMSSRAMRVLRTSPRFRSRSRQRASCPLEGEEHPLEPDDPVVDARDPHLLRAGRGVEPAMEGADAALVDEGLEDPEVAAPILLAGVLGRDREARPALAPAGFVDEAHALGPGPLASVRAVQGELLGGVEVAPPADAAGQAFEDAVVVAQAPGPGKQVLVRVDLEPDIAGAVPAPVLAGQDAPVAPEVRIARVLEHVRDAVEVRVGRGLYLGEDWM